MEPEAAHGDDCAVFWEPPFPDAILHFAARNWDNCAEGSETFGCHNLYHYTDIDISPSSPVYESNLPGAFNIDVVHSINAAIDVLKGDKPPAPFPADMTKTEALLILAHLVGDLHQPMNAGSIYLNKDGSITSVTTGEEATDAGFTRGGNWLWLKKGNVHRAWGKVSPDMRKEAVKEAKVHSDHTAGALSTWAETWANGSIRIAKTELEQLEFGPEDGKRHWRVSGNTDNYGKKIEATQVRQLAIAGHHFADLLNALWP